MKSSEKTRGKSKDKGEQKNLLRTKEDNDSNQSIDHRNGSTIILDKKNNKDNSDSDGDQVINIDPKSSGKKSAQDDRSMFKKFVDSFKSVEKVADHKEQSTKREETKKTVGKN